MRHEDVAEQLDYLFWLRDRILAAAAELSPETFRSADPITTRSLRGTLAQQFTEAAVLLTRLGHSPGEIGFLEFGSASPASSGHGSIRS